MTTFVHLLLLPHSLSLLLPELYTSASMASTANPKIRHVAVCAFPFGTHAAPLLLLIRRLAAAAPPLHFSFLNTDRSNTALFRSIDELPNIRPIGVGDGAPEGDSAVGGIEAIEMFLKAAPENFRRGVAAAEAEVGAAVECVVSDAFLWFCGEMAEERGAGWVPLWTASPASLSCHVYTDVFRRKVGLQGIEARKDESADCVPGFANIRICDLPTSVVSGPLDSPFSQMFLDMALALPKATAVAINSFEELDPTISSDLKSTFNSFLNIGPFPLTSPQKAVNPDPHGCIPWLDRHEPGSVAYISFGTVTCPPAEEIVALAEALEKNDVTFLWSMNDKSRAELPKGLIERISGNRMGKVVPWAPQQELLGRPAVGVFVTHCGWNSITESIVGGVPMICRPFFGDQMLNMRFIESEWRIGVGVRDGRFTVDGTAAALKKVLKGKEGEEMGERAKALKELAFKAVEPEGSSSKNFKALIDIVAGSQDT